MKRFISAIIVCFMTGLTLFGCSSTEVTKPDQFDATKLPFYEGEYMNKEYSYTDEERLQPYWQGNIMRNEQLMVVEKNGVTQGKLLYPALKVISVRDWSLKKEYVENVDYVVKGDTLTLPEGSSIPVYKDEWSRCENVPSAYPEGDAGSGYMNLGGICYTESSLIWGNYIHVTYAYDASLVDRTKITMFSDSLYGLKSLLTSKEEVKLVVFGDSISEGCSSSKLWGHDPFCPSYAELVQQGIEKYGKVKVNLKNMSVGGKDSSWGADDEQTAKLMNENPDILIIGFGTNDSQNNIEGKKYSNNIRQIVTSARIANPNCQIILLAPFPSNPLSKITSLMETNVQKLKDIASDDSLLDVVVVSMYESCMEMLNKKNYYEISGNGINHPNDFITRCYAMNILSAMFDFNSVK